MWDVLVQFGVICLFIVCANILRRRVPFLRRSLIPTAVIGGFAALILRSVGWLDFININLLDGIVYHTMALGFIALALKQRYGKKKEISKESKINDGINSGATIVGTYLIQGIVGLGITLLLSVTIMTWLFPAGGILLGIAFGQGQGQASNFGRIYEELGFTGGQSFALSLASLGFIIAAVVSVIYINVLKKRGKISIEQIEEASKVTEPDPENEMPLSEPIDRMTMTIGTIMIVFMINFVFLFGLDRLLIESGLLGDFGVETVRPLLFGFNFIFALLFALLYKKVSLYKTLSHKNHCKNDLGNFTSVLNMSSLLSGYKISPI